LGESGNLFYAEVNEVRTEGGFIEWLAEKEIEHQATLGCILFEENSVYQVIVLLEEPLVVGFIEMSEDPKGIHGYTLVFIESKLIEFFLSMVVSFALCQDAKLMDSVHADSAD